jgi:hypothetical protein
MTCFGEAGKRTSIVGDPNTPTQDAGIFDELKIVGSIINMGYQK